MLENPGMQRYSTCKAKFAILSVTIRLLRTISRKLTLNNMAKDKLPIPVAASRIVAALSGKGNDPEAMEIIVQHVSEYRDCLQGDEVDTFERLLEKYIRNNPEIITSAQREKIMNLL
jgi:hypothetical protein